MTTKKVPVVIYKDGKRIVVGEATVDENLLTGYGGPVKCEMYNLPENCKVVLGVEDLQFSIGPVKEQNGRVIRSDGQSHRAPPR